MKKKMTLTQTDFNEVEKLAELINKIDKADIHYFDLISDEIFSQQPFFLSSLLGFTYDVSGIEHDEIFKIYFLIWEYFKAKNKIPSKKITEAYFEKIVQRNVAMFNYCDGDLNEEDKMEVYFYDLQNLQSKALLTAVFFRFKNRPVLIKMDNQIKSIVLIGIKSFLECFEKL